MKHQKWLSLLLAICMVVTLLPSIVYAEENVLFSEDVYDDISLETATGTLNGSGTAADPFQIWTAGDLYLVNYVESWNYWNAQDGSEFKTYYYKQMADLDLSGAEQFTKTYGYITANFGGVYDGNGFAISGMDKPLFYFTLGSYVGDAAGNVFTNYQYGTYNPGIFSAEVKNVTIKAPSIDQTVAADVIEQIGAVAAYAINTTFYNCKVEGGSIRGVSGAAAIAGRAGSVVLEGCSSDASITSGLHRASGLVSNLRIYDTKKGADTTSIVSNCSFSGAISGANDGSRGTGGIVGGLYADAGDLEPRFKLPFYIKGCTFSGTIETWCTGYRAHVGGILGIVFNGAEAVVENNTVTGKITTRENLGSLYIGGVLGGIAGVDSDPAGLVIQNNDSSAATLPATDSAKNTYVGEELGLVDRTSYVLDSPVSFSVDGSNASIGTVLKTTFGEGFAIENLAPGTPWAIPNASVTLRVQEGAVLPALTQGEGGTLTIYNEGEIGDINSFGNITIYSNSGTIGNVSSESGTVAIGYGNQTADSETGRIGNAGTIGNITAKGTVNIYRNAADAVIGDVSSQTSSVVIGQNNALYKDYNTNAGTIGNVTAATSVSIYADVAGSVAHDGQQAGTIKAGTTVAIGFTASGTNYLNKNRIGNIEAGTSVSIYNSDVEIGSIDAGTTVSVAENTGTVGDITAESTITIGSKAIPNAGDIGNLISTANEIKIYNGEGDLGTVTAQTSSTIYTNAGTIGDITTVTGAVTVGANNSKDDVTGSAGNTGRIGNITAMTNITVYRNWATDSVSGIIGDLKAQLGSITIGQNTADTAINTYNTNSGFIGDVNAATSVAIYAANANGKVAQGGTVEAGTTVTVGSTSIQNGNIIGGIYAWDTGSRAINIYNNEAGYIDSIVSKGTGTITIGSTAVPNAGPVGSITALAGTVTGYTTAPVGTINASKDTLVYASQAADSYTAAANIIVRADADKTLVVDETSGSTLYTFEAGPANITLNGNRNITVEAGATVSTLSGTNHITVKKNEGTIGTISTKNGNITVTDNSGTITGPIQTGTGSISVTNNGTISGDIAYTGTGTHTVKVTNTAEITGAITNENGSGAMEVDNKNTAAPMAGNITNNTGALTLKATGYTKDNSAAFTGTIKTNGNLFITTSLGGNSADKAINVTFASDTATVTANGEYYFYIKATADSALKNATVISNTKVDGTAFKNTVDLSALTLTSLTKSVGAGTEVLTQAGTGESTLTPVKVTSNTVTEDATGPSYYAGGILHVPADKSVSTGNTLTLSGASTLLNYGTIGDIIYTGTGTLSIYNIGGTIGNITSNGSVTIVSNTGAIGTVDAKAAITVGVAKTAGEVIPASPIAGDLASYYPGNGGENTTSASIGALTAGTGAVNIYRNVGTIGNIASENASVQVGQYEPDYSAYNTNTGTIGNITAKTTVNLYAGTEGGSVAKDGKITAGTSVSVGYTSGTNYYTNANSLGTVEAGTTIVLYKDKGDVAGLKATNSITIGKENLGLNGAAIGPVQSNSTISICNGSGSIVSVTATGTVTVLANGGTIGDIASQNDAVTVGSGSKKADSTGTVPTAYGNNSESAVIGNITAKTSVTVCRNLGTIGNIEAKQAITIGSNTTDAEILSYNTNSGTIGSLTSDIGAIAVYAVNANGKIAVGTEQAIRTGGGVTIGKDANNRNGNQLGPVYAGTSISVYNGESGSIASLQAGTTVSVSANSGAIGDIEAVSNVSVGAAATPNTGTVGDMTSTGGTVTLYNDNASVGDIDAYSTATVGANKAELARVSSRTGSVNIGASNKDASNANGAIGNEGIIHEIVAQTTVTVYRNTGTIGKITSETSNITIGQDSSTNSIIEYNTNSGTIGTIDAAGSVYIYAASTEGRIAMGEGEAVLAGTSIRIGYTNVANGNTIGPVTAGTSITVGVSGKPNAGVLTSLTAGTTITAYNAAAISTLNVNKTNNLSLTVSDGAQPSAVYMENGTTTITNTGTTSPVVNVTTSGGIVKSEKTGDVYATVNVTATDALVAGDTATLNGAFSTVIHNGAGTVYMETKETTIDNIVKNSTGDVKTYGSIGSETDHDGAQSYLLSLVANGNTADVYLLSADGTALPAGVLDVTLTAENAAIAPEAPYTITGGSLSEKFAVLTLNASGTTVISLTGTFTADGGEAVPVTLETDTVTVAPLVDRVDTVFIADAEAFEAAKAAYGWGEDVTAPAQYPVLAVMPVVTDGLADVSLQIDGTSSSTGIWFIAVDMTDKTAGSQLTVTVTASKEGYPSYSDTATYILTAADIAKADTGETIYHYVTYRHMDAITADLVEPVADGESITLPTPERSGYTFLGWTADGSEVMLTAGTSYTPDGDVVLTANWAAQSTAHTLNITTTTGGEVKRIIDDETYDIASGTSFTAGTVVTLKANYYGGYVFQNWVVSGTENYTISGDTVTVTMDNNVTVTANFDRPISHGSGVRKYYNNIAALSNGTVTVSLRNASAGQTITVTPTANEGYKLSDLTVVTTKDGSTVQLSEQNGVYTYTMPASDVTIRAVFVSTSTPVEPGCENGNNCAAKKFTDVNVNAWYHEAIDYVVINGMMNGVSTNQFQPDTSLSRAMMVQVLYNLEGAPAASTAAVFDDVSSNAWFANAIAWAVEHDIVAGYGDGSFGPDDSLTREQMAAILYRYAAYKGYDTTANSDLTKFTDAAAVSDWATESMGWAVGNGLISGKDGAVLDPANTATRAEVAQILMNFCETVAK